MRLPIAKMRVMHNMKPGDVAVFQGLQKGQSMVTSLQAKIGGQFTQEAAIVVGVDGDWCERVTLVTCVDRPNRRKKRGRPRGSKNMKGQPNDHAQPELLPGDRRSEDSGAAAEGVPPATGSAEAPKA